MPERATLFEVLESALDTRLANVHVACPGVVRSYDRATQRATITPAVVRTYFGEGMKLQQEPFDDLEGVPVVWPRQGQGGMHADLVAGDTVELVFQEAPIGEWRTGDGSPQPHAEQRRHSSGYPVAIPGLYPDGAPYQAPGAGLSFGYQGAGQVGRTLYTPTGVQVGEGAGVPLALAPAVVEQLALIVDALKAVATGVSTLNTGTGASTPTNVAAIATKIAALTSGGIPATVAKGV